MKRIIIIGPAHPLRGGLATFDERLAREFAQLGYEVRIVTFSLQYPEFLFPGKTQLSSDPAPEDLNIEITINAINPFNWFSVGLRLRRERADIVICRFWLPFMAPCLGTILQIIKSNKHTKVIGLIDNIVPHEKRLGDNALAKYFISSCHSFVAMSQSVVEEMRHFTKTKKILLSPHPIYDNYGNLLSRETALALLGLHKNKRYLLFFGFIRAYKGLDLLLEAIAELKKRVLTEGGGIMPILLIAGEFYEDEKKYVEKIYTLNIEADVKIYSDFIPTNEVNRYFSAADLIVQPYKSATQSGISQIAYHFNKPMIVTNVGGLPEIVPNGEVGYVVETNPLDIADAIQDFYTNKKEDSFQQGLERQKLRFSWKNMVTTFETLF